MAVRTLGNHEVALYKSLRLRALHGDPSAFGSSHAWESSFDDDTRRSRLAGFAGRPGVVMVDEDDRRATGMVGIGESAEPDEAIVWGMWVDPEHRRRGIAQRLLAAAIEWARDRSSRTVILNVRDGNQGAHLLYLRFGFVEVDRTADSEIILRLNLGDVST